MIEHRAGARDWPTHRVSANLLHWITRKWVVVIATKNEQVLHRAELRMIVCMWSVILKVNCLA